MRTRHMSPRTEEAYLGWIRRYLAQAGPAAKEPEVAIARFLSDRDQSGRRRLDPEPGASCPPVLSPEGLGAGT